MYGGLFFDLNIFRAKKRKNANLLEIRQYQKVPTFEGTFRVLEKFVKGYK